MDRKNIYRQMDRTFTHSWIEHTLTDRWLENIQIYVQKTYRQMCRKYRIYTIKKGSFLGILIAY